MAGSEAWLFSRHGFRLAKNGVNYGRLGTRNPFGFKGRYYTPGTINTTILKSFRGGSAVRFAFGVSLITNLADYSSIGSQADQGYGQEFAVSTAVDTVAYYLTGAAASLLVGAFVVSTTPFWVVAGATVVVAVGLSMTLDYFEVPKKAKIFINDQIDTRQGEAALKVY